MQAPIEEGIAYLNEVRKNPSKFSAEIGQNLDGLKSR